MPSPTTTGPRGAEAHLREAAPEDLVFVMELEAEFCRRGFVGMDEAATHRAQMADPGCRYYVIEVRGKAAGFVILRGLTSVNGCVELQRIVVAEPGGGLGRAVLHAILGKVFDDFSAHRLWLDVYDHNHRARHLYRSLGFVEEGTLRESVRRGGEYWSLVVMSMLEREYRSRYPSQGGR